MATEKITTRRRLQGVVIKNAMNKTVVVQVDNATIHPKYLKRLVTSQRYHAHDENDAAQLGDKVVIEETRPLSKTKTWRIVKITKE